MDGLTFLRQIMSQNPFRLSFAQRCQRKAAKSRWKPWRRVPSPFWRNPSWGLKQFLDESRREMIQTLKTAAKSKPRGRSPVAESAASQSASKKQSLVGSVHAFAMNKPVVIGSSTGGTQALEMVLTNLPADAPGIAITQHMPEKFTAMYAKRLDGICAMNVREARDGDRLERGVVLIAPGGLHMQLRKNAGQYFVHVVDGPPVNRHKPSVDVLFRSASECGGRDVLGIILTGMGDDGARGMKVLHDGGARTIAQNEETCVVFGMPKEAINCRLWMTFCPWSRSQGPFCSSTHGRELTRWLPLASTLACMQRIQ
jgi:two-component system chemotaxis response regulator CheB